MSQYQTLGGEGSVATFATRDDAGAARGTPRRGAVGDDDEEEQEAVRFHDDGDDRRYGRSSGEFPSQRPTSPSSSLPNMAPSLSFEGEEQRGIDVTIDPAGFSGAESDFDAAPANFDDGDDNEPSFLRRARASPPSSDAGSGASRNMRRSRRPWDELKDESTATDQDRDRSLLQGRLGTSFASVNVTRESDNANSWRGSDTGTGGVLLGADAVEPTPLLRRSGHPQAGGDEGRRTLSPRWDPSDEATPLLSNNAGNGHGARGGSSRADTNTNSLSEVASSWATGASMRFRDPLHRRRDFAAAGMIGGSPAWSGGLMDGSMQENTDSRDDASKGRRKRGVIGAFRTAADGVRNFARRRRRGEVVVGADDATGCGGCSNLGEAFFDLLRQEDMAAAAAAAGKTALRPRFSRILCALLVIHFGAMALFDLILLIRSALSSEQYDAPPLWLGAAGLAYNPLIGPASSTLSKFGATGPALVLLKAQSWRLVTAATMSTSLTQLLLNLWTVRTAVAELERRIGASSAAGIYAASALVGGVWSSALRIGLPEGATAEVSGLAGAGVAGLLAACLVEMGLGAWGESQRRQHGRVGASTVGGVCGWLPRPGLAHALLLLAFLPCPFPYSSLAATLGGAVAGLGCGTFLFASLARGPRTGGHGHRRDESTEPGSSHVDDGARSEALFDPVMTPTRRLNYGITPPGMPPDSSPSVGRGMTPRMRRSILASPGAVDEENNADEAFAYGDASSPIRDSTFRDDDAERGKAAAPASVHAASTRQRNCAPLLRLAGLALALQAAAVPPLLLAAGILQPIPAAEETALEELQEGCRYLKRLHPAGSMWTEGVEADAEGWACSEACVPLGLVRRAAGRRTWSSGSFSELSSSAGSSGSTSSAPRWGVVRAGRCSVLGYRCGPTASYELYLGSSRGDQAEAEVYVPPGSDGTCPSVSAAAEEGEDEEEAAE